MEDRIYCLPSCPLEPNLFVVVFQSRFNAYQKVMETHEMGTGASSQTIEGVRNVFANHVQSWAPLPALTFGFSKLARKKHKI